MWCRVPLHFTRAGAAKGIFPSPRPTTPTLICFPDCQKPGHFSVALAPPTSFDANLELFQRKLCPADQWPNHSNDHYSDLLPPVQITGAPQSELHQNLHTSAFDLLTPSLPISIPQYALSFGLSYCLLASGDTTMPYDLGVGIFIDLLSAGSSLGGGTTRSSHGTIGELRPVAVLQVFPWNDALVLLTYGTNRTSISVCVIPDSQWRSQCKYYIHRNEVPKI